MKMRARLSLPHARGGVSKDRSARAKAAGSSPRTWGCFRGRAARPSRPAVFPTHVGVFRSLPHSASSSLGLPHARGGVSVQRDGQGGPGASSPRTWGCFSGSPCSGGCQAVFPTHVGVFLCRCQRQGQRQGLPHARGGVSDYLDLRPAVWLSSPRTWGCFFRGHGLYLCAVVFPTHVGVFRRAIAFAPGVHGLPHARGGVSSTRVCTGKARWSSPRTWGCF